MHAAHDAAVGFGFDIDDVGVQEDAYVARGLQLAPVVFSETHRQAELRQAVLDFTTRKRHAAHILAADRRDPVSDVVVRGTQVQHPVGTLVEGSKLFQAEGPAAVRHPIALAEVLGIHRPAPAAPAVAATTEEAAAVVVAEVVRNAGVLAAMEVHRVRVGREAAAFEHDGLDAAALEFERHRQTRRPAADDADRRPRHHRVVEATRITEHCSQLPGREPCRCAHPAPRAAALQASEATNSW